MTPLALALWLAAAGDEPPPSGGATALHDSLVPQRGEARGQGPVPPSLAPPPQPTSPTPPPPVPPQAPREPAVHLTAIPLLTYGSDVGLQLGAAAYLYQLDRDGERGDWGALGLSWTAHGPRSVEAKGELLDLWSTSLRAFFQVKAAVDPEAPYWGEGAALGGFPVAPGSGTAPAPFLWRNTGPWASLLVRGALSGPLGWWARYRFTDVAVGDPGPALRAAAPPGRHGGPSSLVHAGVLYDSRDRESSPRRGVLADASLFASPPLAPLAAQQLVGGDVGLRAYFEPWRGAVLAVRGLYDLKLGDVPFYERALYEGLGYGEGLGGAGTIRGLARDRLSGEEKLLVGAELRTWLVETHWLGRRQDWGLSAGGDAGRARDRGYAPVLGAGVFGGLRAFLDQAVIIRFEVGYAGQGALAYYLDFDEAF